MMLFGVMEPRNEAREETGFEPRANCLAARLSLVPLYHRMESYWPLASGGGGSGEVVLSSLACVLHNPKGSGGRQPLFPESWLRTFKLDAEGLDIACSSQVGEGSLHIGVDDGQCDCALLVVGSKRSVEEMGGHDVVSAMMVNVAMKLMRMRTMCGVSTVWLCLGCMDSVSSGVTANMPESVTQGVVLVVPLVDLLILAADPDLSSNPFGDLISHHAKRLG